MNLYLISQSRNTGIDTYESAVVAAETEEDARLIFPSDYCEPKWYVKESAWIDRDGYINSREWVDPADVIVRLIGVATEGLSGLVHSSYIGW